MGLGEGASLLAQRFDDDESGMASGCSVVTLSECSSKPTARRFIFEHGDAFESRRSVGEALDELPFEALRLRVVEELLSERMAGIQVPGARDDNGVRLVQDSLGEITNLANPIGRRLDTLTGNLREIQFPIQAGAIRKIRGV